MNKLTKKDTLEEEKNKYSDFELNELEYIEAIRLDRRTLWQIYWFALKRGHLILTFINCNDYNLLYNKISRCIFLFVTHIALNAFFFSNYTIHKLYLNNGKYDFCQQIPQIVYSILISQLIEIFLCFLSLTDKHFYHLNKNLTSGSRKEIKKTKRSINIKLIVFYIFISIFFIFFGYIISIFCGIYRNSQIHLIITYVYINLILINK